MITNFISSENGLKSGGTISGDVTISGDLTVEGSGSAVYDEIIQGSLHIETDDAPSDNSALTANTGGDELVIENSDHAGLSILTPDNKIGNIFFGNVSDTARAGLQYYHENVDSNERLLFNVAGGERMRLTSAGQLGIGVSPDKLLTLGQDAIDGGQTAYLKILDTDTDTTADTRLEILFSKYHTGTSAADVASIGGGVEQWSGFSGNRNAYLEFMTVASGTRGQALKLNSDKSALFSGQIHLGSTNQFRIYSEGSGGSDNQVILAKLNNLTILNQHNGGNISFGTDTSGGTAVTNMILDSDSRISLSNNDSGASNTVFGKDAGKSLVTGADKNTFIGCEVADAIITDSADNNTGIGAFSLSALTSGTANTTVGYNSGNAITSGGQNTALGSEALKNCDDGTHNVAIGNAANFANAGDFNVAVGSQALVSNVGNRNVAVGYQALNATDNSGDGYSVGIGYKALTAANGIGIENVAIGGNAGLIMTTGHENVLIGSGAGAGTTATDESILIGYHAGQGANITVDGIIGIGYQALQVLTSGTGSTVVGHQAGSSINVGDQNTAFGYQTLKSATTGEYNVAVGYQALLDNVDGSHNTAVGRLALENFEPTNPNEGHNSALGSLAGNDVSTGTFNTCIGSNAGHDDASVNLTTGTQNTFLGAYTNGSGANAGNQTVIGYNADGTGDNEIALGNTSISAIKAQVTSITAYSSDERTKKRCSRL